MPDNILEQYGLPVNTEGEVVATLGTGGRGVAGSLPPSLIPVNAAGEMVINLNTTGGSTGPSAFTSRTLTSADNGATLVCASAQVATVNTGLPTGFGVAFKGVITFNGTATVTDVRTTGAANPWCSLVQTGTNTYDVVGSKA